MEIRRFDQVAATVLVVDRDPLMLTAMASILDMQGHRALLARTEEIAKQAINENELDLIVLAIEELSAGCEFAQRLRSLEKTRDVPVIFLVSPFDGRMANATPRTRRRLQSVCSRSIHTR